MGHLPPTNRGDARSSKLVERSIAVAGLLLAVPKAAYDSAQLAGVKLPLVIPQWAAPAMTKLEWVGCATCAVWFWRRGLVARALRPVADSISRYRLTPFEHRPSDDRRSQYSDLMTTHIRTLEMTSLELASRAKLTLREAEFLVRHPEFFPRIDVEEQVRLALMVPPDWPKNGYGPDFTKQRLCWYASKHHCGYTASRIEAMTNKRRAKILSLIERKLMAGSAAVESKQ